MTGKPERRRQYFPSVEAHNWARNLYFADPEAKSVLVALAFYVNDSGICFASIPRLAQDTELSADTVRRRLSKLEQLGVIVRKPQWIDSSGRRNTQHGKRTTDEIRLQFHLTTDELDRRLQGEEPCLSSSQIHPVAAENLREGNPGSPQGPTSDQTCDGPSPAPAQPSQYGQVLISEPKPKPKSPYPPLSDYADQSERLLQGFIEAWGDPIEKPSEVRKVWQELNFVEQTEAAKAVRAYTACFKAMGKKRRIRNAQKFLQEREAWPTYFKFPESEVTPIAVFEAEGSKAWRARFVLADIAGVAGPTAADYPEGRGRASTPLPAGHMELSRYAEIDPASWRFVPAEDPRSKAWCEFIGIEPRLITVGFKDYEVNGRVIPKWPIKRPGLWVPCDWPPSDSTSEDML